MTNESRLMYYPRDGWDREGPIYDDWMLSGDSIYSKFVNKVQNSNDLDSHFMTREVNK